MKSNSVLVVDDDPTICTILDSILEQSGYQATVVHSGEEALALLTRERYAAVITDLKMGDVDGLEVTLCAKRYSPATPIIMITGCNDEENRLAAFACGVSAFLEKPFDLDALLDALPHLQEEVRQEKSCVEEDTSSSDGLAVPG